MQNSMSQLRRTLPAILVAVMGGIVPSPAEEAAPETGAAADLGGDKPLGYLAQAAWLGISPPVPPTRPDGGSVAKPRVTPRAVPSASSPAVEEAAEEMSDDLEILINEAAAARSTHAGIEPPAPAERGSRFVSWTERYELGPGDSLNFSLHGQPELAKRGVPVAPDSTISYLQAKQVSVRGLTVEELRARMEQVLSEFHRDPKVIVTPAVLGSKKYTVLGKVKSNDIYKLDRPTTLLEAIAKAKGIVVGVRNSNATELADLRRSFVVRAGEKVEVDIERLYKSGDLTQNIQIEPGDYIYIASNVHNEAYVFGSVVQSGMLPLSGRLTVMGAIAESGGYAKFAWRKRVLLVRGSVGSPEATVINTREVLRGNEKDLLLEPGDIVYVHQRPWAYAEEILDIAIKSYIQSATAVAIQGEDAVTIGL